MVSDNDLKGNWGEQYVASHLAACGCLIRHVPQGHDSGIDLYCEYVKDNKPFLHFFVQVKTSENNPKDLIGKDKNPYLKSQPVPVLFFLVNDNGDRSIAKYSIISILDYESKEHLIEINDLVDFRDLKKKFFDDEGEFKGYLIKETFRWNLSKGNICPLPQLNPTGEWFLADTTPEYSGKISSTLYLALWRFCEDHLKIEFDFVTPTLKFKEGKSIADLKNIDPYFRALENIHENFEEKKHVVMIALGLWYCAHEKNKGAKGLIEDGIKSAENIKEKLPNQEDRKRLEENINSYKKYLQIINDRLDGKEQKL